MNSKPSKPIRGVFERPAGSNIWWILYYANGKRHREKVGRKSDAITLYQTRKSDDRRGIKVPDLRRQRKVTIADLIDDALIYARANSKSIRDYLGKAELIRADFGATAAEDLKPAEFTAWIERRKVAPATFNRYKAFLSLCYREGIRNGKVELNVARKLRTLRESKGRKRFLSREEYATLLETIETVYPPHKPDYILSVFTGMRLMEQYSVDWSQVDFARGEINLTFTKNGDDRTVPMNSVVKGVLKEMHDTARPKNKDLVFPRKFNGKKAVQPRWFGDACEKAQIDNYTWHNNRHTFCSWHAIAGTPLKTIQELAGHKTISITARYAHLCPDHKQTETERIVEVPNAKVVPMKKKA